MRKDLQHLEQLWAMALQVAGFGAWNLNPRQQTVQYAPAWKAGSCRCASKPSWWGRFGRPLHSRCRPVHSNKPVALSGGQAVQGRLNIHSP